MNNIKIVKDSDGNDVVIIDHGNDQFTSMPKSVYDEQQEHLQTIVPMEGAN